MSVPCVCYMFCPTHPPSFGQQRNNIRVIQYPKLRTDTTIWMASVNQNVVN